MRTRVLGSIGAVVCSVVALGCGPHSGASGSTEMIARSAKTSPPVAVAAAAFESPAPVPSPESLAPVAVWEKSWQGFGVPKCSYLAPASTSDFIAEDGGVDVVFHFHAGQMSERDMKASGVHGVFVSCGYGMGTGGYSSAFEDPHRFGWMMKQLMWTLGQRYMKSEKASANVTSAASNAKPHLRHLALVSWSAGFASVNRILAVPEWYAATDTVVLLDSLHAQYIDSFESPNPHTPAQGVEKVDTRGLRRFERFAADAVAGKKTMVITHSSIIPPDYASTSEATAALLSDIGAVAEVIEKGSPAEKDGPRLPESNMALASRLDQGNLHVRGFRGTGPHDHFDHLHLIGEALRSWLVPRWYTPGGERP